jgi:nucleoside-triphosphatase THEP1
MAHAPLRILLTGAPGCGKTTAVMKIVNAWGAEDFPFCSFPCLAYDRDWVKGRAQ